MKYVLVWQGKHARRFTVTGDGAPYSVVAFPIVTCTSLGISAGFFYRGPASWGQWLSPRRCDLFTAWRTTQTLRKVKRLRCQGTSNITLDQLVLAMNGNRDEAQMSQLAFDLGTTASALDTDLRRQAKLWPSAGELYYMWRQLPEHEQNLLAGPVRAAIRAGSIAVTQPLTNLIEAAELRLHTADQRLAAEDARIVRGLPPESSLRQFLVDLGVTNLAWTFDVDEGSGRTHFDLDDVDRQILSELIGTYGCYEHVELVMTAIDPDPTGRTYDYGPTSHPRIVIGGSEGEIISAKWDRYTERFLLTIRPTGLADGDHSRDVQMHILDLRVQIGANLGLGRYLAPGERPAWVRQP